MIKFLRCQSGSIELVTAPSNENSGIHMNVKKTFHVCHLETKLQIFHIASNLIPSWHDIRKEIHIHGNKHSIHLVHLILPPCHRHLPTRQNPCLRGWPHPLPRIRIIHQQPVEEIVHIVHILLRRVVLADVELVVDGFKMSPSGQQGQFGRQRLIPSPWRWRRWRKQWRFHDKQTTLTSPLACPNSQRRVWLCFCDPGVGSLIEDIMFVDLVFGNRTNVGFGR